MADYDDVRRFGAVVLRLEGTAAFGSKAESLKEVCCYRYAAYAPGLAAVAEVEFPQPCTLGSLMRKALLLVTDSNVVRVAELIKHILSWIRELDSHQALRLGERKRP
jgi:hypothetical protein